MQREEMETVIQIDKVGSVARVWTCDSVYRTTLRRRGYNPIKRQGPGAWYEIPRQAISIRRVEGTQSRRKRTLPADHPFRRRTRAVS